MDIKIVKNGSKVEVYTEYSEKYDEVTGQTFPTWNGKQVFDKVRTDMDLVIVQREIEKLSPENIVKRLQELNNKKSLLLQVKDAFNE